MRIYVKPMRREGHSWLGASRYWQRVLLTTSSSEARDVRLIDQGVAWVRFSGRPFLSELDHGSAVVCVFYLWRPDGECGVGKKSRVPEW